MQPWCGGLWVQTGSVSSLFHYVTQAAITEPQLGRLGEARSATKAGLALSPTFTVTRFHVAWAAMSDDPTYLSQFKPILEGMRKAGVPEQ